MPRPSNSPLTCPECGSAYPTIDSIEWEEVILSGAILSTEHGDVTLGPIQNKLMTLLMSAQGKKITRYSLYDSIYGELPDAEVPVSEDIIGALIWSTRHRANTSSIGIHICTGGGNVWLEKGEPDVVQRAVGKYRVG